MKIQTATRSDLALVMKIVQETIDSVYPKYYPQGAVSFFKAHHSAENISADLESGAVFLLYDGSPVATVTICRNHIARLFVLPEEQHKGYGKALLDFAEQKISAEYSEIELDASFPAKHIYLKRGYAEKEFCKEQTENGDFLCYDVMRKSIRIASEE